MTAAPPASLRAYADVLRSPERFARLLTIVDKWGKRVPLRYNRVQREFMSRVKIGERVTHIVVKPRQVGFTTAIEALCLQLNLTRADLRTVTLFDKIKNTQPARRVVDLMYKSLPTVINAGEYRIQTPALNTDNDVERIFSNGSSWAMDTAGVGTTGRSRTLDVIHGSEVAYWTDADGIASGALEAAQFAILRMFESTTNGASGWFFEQAMRAQDGDPLLRLHFFPWWYADEYRSPLDEGETLAYDPDERDLIRLHGLDPEQIKWRREKKRDRGVLFDQEYPESVETCFLQSGGGFFGHLATAFEAPAPSGKPNGARVIAGLDWGQANDYTTFHVADATNSRQLDLLRVNRLSYADMRSQIVARCRQWGVSEIMAEANSMGSTNIEELQRELFEAGLPTTVTSYTTTNTSKRNDLLSLNNALSTGEYTMLPLAVQRAEFRAYQAVQTASGNWTYSAPPGQHDDTVIAAMLMWHILNAPEWTMDVSTVRYA